MDNVESRARRGKSWRKTPVALWVTEVKCFVNRSLGSRRPKVNSRYGRWNSCLHYQVHNISRVNRTSYTKVHLLVHHCGRGRDSHPFPSLRRHRSVYAYRVGDPCFRTSVCTNMQATETKTDLCRAIRPAFHSYFVLGWTENGTNNELSTTKGSCCTLLTIWRLYFHSTTNKQTNKHKHTHTQAMCSGILFKI